MSLSPWLVKNYTTLVTTEIKIKLQTLIFFLNLKKGFTSRNPGAVHLDNIIPYWLKK